MYLHTTQPSAGTKNVYPYLNAHGATLSAWLAMPFVRRKAYTTQKCAALHAVCTLHAVPVGPCAHRGRASCGNGSAGRTADHDASARVAN